MRSHDAKQFLAGAAVAAFLIAPTAFAHAGPLVPPAPSSMQGTILVDAHSGWVTKPSARYSVHSVRVKDLVGTLTVHVGDSGPVTVKVAGTKSRVDGLDVHQSGKTLKIEGTRTNAVWDWRDWFNFSIHDKSEPQNLQVTLTVPRGTAFKISDMIGDAVIGDTMAPLDFEAAASTAMIGKVGRAKLSMAGSGKIGVASVDGPLKLEIAGSGKIRVGRSGPVSAEVAGAGDAQLGDIDGGLKLDIAGSGDVVADSVNGPVKIKITGSGSIKIAKGQADPLHVSIVGSGNFDFGGNAVDPELSAFGSGRVRLKSYTGHLSASGSVNVKIGDKSISTGNDD